MSRLKILGLSVAAVALLAAPAQARVFYHVGIGFGGFGVPYYYPPPIYYAPPPPVYYAPPPPVVYAPPSYYAPPPSYAPPAAYAPPASYAPPPAAAPTSDAAPTAEAAPAQGQCQPYSTTSVINGQPQELHGTACLQPDGTWRIGK